MKITTAQLKKIISEEIQKAIVESDEQGVEGGSSQVKKRDYLRKAISDIRSAQANLELALKEDPSDFDINSPIDDLSDIRRFIASIISSSPGNILPPM